MTLLFTGDKNYLKRSPLSGHTTITGPNVATGWATFESSQTITHGLGYVPLVRVYYDPFNNGKLFTPVGDRLVGGQPYSNNIGCIVRVNTTNLIIYLSASSSVGGSVPIYWVIYLQTPT